MLEFYKKALLGVLGLVMISVLAAFLAVKQTFLRLPLLPNDAGRIPWHTGTSSDEFVGGRSSVVINDDQYSLDFSFTLSDAAKYPFAAAALIFGEKDKTPALTDFSAYSSVSFRIKCSPANELSLSIFTADAQITQVDNPSTYRSPSAFFSCGEQWQRVDIDLNRLEIPQWWIDKYQLKLSMKDYKLDKVSQIQFSSTYQGSTGVDSRVQVNELTFKGRDSHYLYVLGAFLVLLWSGYGIWFFRQHTQSLISDLRSKLQRERPLVAYQQLTVDPKHDKEKRAILQFMATNYANPELSLDHLMTATGVGRTKINEILKAELGFTFSSYLNKLRLTEAARLLTEKDEANIAEIAYSVGYNNVSYFNKLFKEEYGCTPNVFKIICDKAYSDH